MAVWHSNEQTINLASAKATPFLNAFWFAVTATSKVWTEPVQVISGYAAPLVRLWPELWLSPRLRHLWEAGFPQLAATR